MNPRPLPYQITLCNRYSQSQSVNGKLPESFDSTKKKFYDFLTVDLQLDHNTAHSHYHRLNALFKRIGKPLSQITTDDIREALKMYDKPNTKAGVVKSLRRFYRDFLGCPEVVATFRISQPILNIVKPPSRKRIAEVVKSLPLKYQAFYMLLATSGIRVNEAFKLTRDRYDPSTRMLDLKGLHRGNTKQSWISFINEETAEILNRSLVTHNSEKLFAFSRYQFRRVYRKTGLKPQALRDFFACEMGDKGVPDRFIDAFQGRVPRSVLARHYSDYSPERLKKIYDQANLRVLS